MSIDPQNSYLSTIIGSLRAAATHSCVAISVCIALELNLVGPEAGSDRRVGRIGNAEVPKQEIAPSFAKTLTAIAPDRHDAVDFALNFGGYTTIGEARAYIHRQIAAQRLKTRMQLGAYRPGNRARIVVLWPELKGRK